MTVIQTTDFDSNLLVRDVNEEFQLLLADNRSIMSEFMTNGSGYRQGTNQKYEWTESQLSATKFTVNGAVVLNANPATTTVTFDSTTGMKAGYILSFKDTSGNDVESATGVINVIVTSVTNGTDAVVLVMPGQTATTIPDDAVATFTEGVEENRKAFAGENTRQPILEYNNFQIFKQEVELSDTVINSLMYADPNYVSNQLNEAMYKIMQKMQVACSDGFRIQRGTDLGGGVISKGSMQGYKRYIDNVSGNVVDASSGSLTSTFINDAMQAILEDGGNANTIICNYQKAREISAFNTGGSNPIVQIQRSDTTTGTVTQSFLFDMPVEGGKISRIVVDDKMSNDKVILSDINRIALVPFNNRSMRLVQTTLPGQDGVSYELRGEYTLVTKDAKQSHAIIKNLA